MKTLYIIGNGFDIYHELPTKYSEFYNHVKKNNPVLFRTINTYIDHGDEQLLWNELEKYLRDIDEDAIEEFCSSYLVSYGDPDWSDSMHHDYQYCIKEIVDCMTETLLEELTFWIIGIQSKICNIEEKVKIDKNAFFLTFNYTTTLEDVYNISNSNIVHIHNSILSNRALILGHNYSLEDRKIDENKLSDIKTKGDIDEILARRSAIEIDFRFSEGQESIRSYYNKSHKDSEMIIRNNIEFFNKINDVNNVIVLGHSVSEVDINYFEMILRCIEHNSKWWFTWHSDSDKNNVFEFIKKNKLENFEIRTIKDKEFSIA